MEEECVERRIESLDEKQGSFYNNYWLQAINKLVMKRLAYKTPLYRIKI